MDAIFNLVQLIRAGTLDKVTLGNITMYKVKNIVRIDIKFDD